jgi:uncharacterized protein
MENIAIVGSGIAGLGCAYFLNSRHKLTLFEQNDYPGGHSNTVDVMDEGKPSPIDTGFMVFNRVTYPNLCRLFSELSVDPKPTDMSFSVQHVRSGIEFSGSSVNHLFAQRRNLLRPRFWRMLTQINRFNHEAVTTLERGIATDLTLRQFVENGAYGKDFMDLYLVPMGSAVWSTPPQQMLEFPAVTLLRFFHNHGFLGLDTQHPWLTLKGGARTYVEKITKRLSDPVRLQQKVISVSRDATGVTINTDDNQSHRFDRVILAAHADQSMKMLRDPDPLESRLLGEFKYRHNVATLHTDESLMPRTKLAWSSWNYRIRDNPAGQITPMTVYWMNRLQGVSKSTNYFVSINSPEDIQPEKVIRTINYEHPVFSLGAAKAQAELHRLNNRGKENRTFFCGAWFKYGFHEDGFTSALQCCRGLTGERIWE